MKGISLKLTDNTAEVLKALDSQVERALEAVGLQAEGYAKMLCPTDTGLLKNSITHAVAGKSASISSYKSNSTHASTAATQRAGTAGKNVNPVKTGKYSGSIGTSDEKAVYVGSNVFYAPYVEYGTSRMKAQPYIKPAIEEHVDEYKQIFEEYLKA